MTERERLADELRRALDGQAWHGPSLAELLDGVTAAQAEAHPVPGAHSIREIVLHLAAWTREARRRLAGAAPAEPAEGDWPTVAADGEDAWRAACDLLAREHRALVATLLDTPEERLDETSGTFPPGEAFDPAVTFSLVLHGIAQHAAYHGGQIALLRRTFA